MLLAINLFLQETISTLGAGASLELIVYTLFRSGRHGFFQAPSDPILDVIVPVGESESACTV